MSDFKKVENTLEVLLTKIRGYHPNCNSDLIIIDFAYTVHTSLGDQAAGAKVDGKMVQLNKPLKSGQTVEIMIDKNKKSPSRDWLNFVVTQLARKEIQKQNFAEISQGSTLRGSCEGLRGYYFYSLIY